MAVLDKGRRNNIDSVHRILSKSTRHSSRSCVQGYNDHDECAWMDNVKIRFQKVSFSNEKGFFCEQDQRGFATTAHSLGKLYDNSKAPACCHVFPKGPECCHAFPCRLLSLSSSLSSSSLQNTFFRRPSNPLSSSATVFAPWKN